MEQAISVLGLLIAVLRITSPILAVGQSTQEKLRADDYDAVALIYNKELSALGSRGL